MFKYGGESNFHGRFDFYEWSAPYYENPKEVYLALKSPAIEGKTLKSINAIGACACIGKYGWQDVYYTIADAGIELGDLWWEKYEHINDVRVPWRAGFCEPVQFVFDDDTTVEIFPTENGGARIGVNSIPIGLVDGLNKSDFNSNELFKEFLGLKLKSIDLRIKKKETHFVNDYSISDGDPYVERRTKYIMHFSFDYPYELDIIQSFGGCYAICGRGDPNHCKINFGRFESARNPIDQAEIALGREGDFWIIGTGEEERKSSHLCLDCFGISIDEMHINEFLSKFLYKYYDPTIQQREEYEDDDFDWYGINLYTSESIRKMLDDIYKAVDLIKENYNDPALDELKSCLSIYEYTDKMLKDLSNDEINELRRKRIPVAIDFYERFCSQMENMLKIPGNNMISFAGP